MSSSRAARWLWAVVLSMAVSVAAVSSTSALPFAIESNPFSISSALFSVSSPQENGSSPALGHVDGRPFPTGAWWTNLVIDKGDTTIVPMPYAVRVREGKLHVSYPFRVVLPTVIQSGFVSEVVLSAAVATSLQHQVVDFDALSVAVAFKSSVNASFTAHLVRGSPFMTVEYSAATPTIESMDGVQITGFRRLDADSALDTKGQRVPFAVFALQLSNGHIWYVFASDAAIELALSADRRRFHYGYFVYALAAVRRFDPAFIDAHATAIAMLIGDIGTPLDRGTAFFSNLPALDYFPTARHKDWFVGHSYASGLFPMEVGKSQESSSESVNAYYALSLFGSLDGDEEANAYVHFARVLLALEIRATKMYWHMRENSQIYEPVFAKNAMVGVVGEMSVVYSTWFGDRPEYVHGINMIPITPITSKLMVEAYVAREFPLLRDSLANLGAVDIWKSVLVMNHAILDAEAAWKELTKSVTAFDTWNSRANALYWIATRPSWYEQKNRKRLTVPNYHEDDKCFGYPECSAEASTSAGESSAPEHHSVVSQVMAIVVGVFLLGACVFCLAMCYRRRHYAPIEHDMRAWYCTVLMLVVAGGFVYLLFCAHEDGTDDYKLATAAMQAVAAEIAATDATLALLLGFVVAGVTVARGEAAEGEALSEVESRGADVTGASVSDARGSEPLDGGAAATPGADWLLAEQHHSSEVEFKALGWQHPSGMPQQSSPSVAHRGSPLQVASVVAADETAESAKSAQTTRYALHSEDSNARPLQWVAHVRLTPELLQRLQQNPESVTIQLNAQASTATRGATSRPSSLLSIVDNDGNDCAEYELLSFREDPHLNHVCAFRSESSPSTSAAGYALHMVGRVHQKLIVQRMLDNTEKDRMKDRHAKSVLESKSRSAKLLENVNMTAKRSAMRTTRSQRVSIGPMDAHTTGATEKPAELTVSRKRRRLLRLPDLSSLPEHVQGICKRVSEYKLRSAIRDDEDYDSFVADYERLRDEWDQLDKIYSIEIILTEGLHIQRSLASDPDTVKAIDQQLVQDAVMKRETLHFLQESMATIHKLLASLQSAIAAFDRRH
ncbi:hypothetical protein P43SY_000561 [Pythium insidiosum]|uniref:glucan endo-1,3-beta-D-glucosidase n=1 Tax=Pythium insidiosum TaxID=114742 RepID=A0AAD5Q2X8_PYTIN|nr:hypothetical protein P43SY_000561 [Pythium insidiosum]